MPNNNQSEEVEFNHQINIHTARLLGYLQQIHDSGQCRCAEIELETILQLVSTHGASEYARWKSEERERILVSIARIGKIDFRLSDVLDAINQENTLKE